jgi:L-Ala-D/L-Glu epimerase
MNSSKLQLHAWHKSWPLAGVFAISRGAKTTAEVVVVELTDGTHSGRAECSPYPRYDETVASVIEQLEGVSGALGNVHTTADIQGLLPAGAARNALDCALWDLLAKQQSRPVFELLQMPAPTPVTSAYTLSLDAPEAMGQAAKARADSPLLKLKLAGAGDLERVCAVRENAPNARIIVDANEGWSPEQVGPFSRALAELGVSMIEQPLPAAADAVLADLEHPVPLCADESCHTSADLDRLVGRYEFVNIKLDKTGGLTEAMVLNTAARARGFRIMVGCMLASSLAMAPAVLVAQGAEITDLDGPLWLADDWDDALRYDGTEVFPPEPQLWG